MMWLIYIMVQALAFSSLNMLVPNSSSWRLDLVLKLSFLTNPEGAFLSYVCAEKGWVTELYGTYGHISARFPVPFTFFSTLFGSTNPVTVTFCIFLFISTVSTPDIEERTLLILRSQPSQSILTFSSTVWNCFFFFIFLLPPNRSEKYSKVPMARPMDSNTKFLV